MTTKATIDLPWLRSHSPTFCKLEQEVIIVKKSETEYREFKKNILDKEKLPE